MKIHLSPFLIEVLPVGHDEDPPVAGGRQLRAQDSRIRQVLGHRQRGAANVAEHKVLQQNSLNHGRKS